MPRIVWTLAFFLGALLWPATDAAACSCIGGRPLCETFWQTPVVFQGQVLAIEPIPESGRSGSLRRRLVTLRVEESFRRSVETVVQIATGHGGGDCGYPFEVGGRYLVYAHDSSGTLSTDICSRTRPLENAAEDLNYLKTAFTPSAHGRVFGSVTRERAPAPGYRINLSGGPGEWTTITDAEGRFEFGAVPPGQYDIRVVVEESEHAYGGPGLGRGQIDLPDARACASATFFVVPNGRVMTRLLDVFGRPLGDVTVSAVAVANPGRTVTSATTSPDGQLVLVPLRPGRYLLGINVNSGPAADLPYPRLFHPGVIDATAATVIDLGYGDRRDVEAFASCRRPATITSTSRATRARCDWS